MMDLGGTVPSELELNLYGEAFNLSNGTKENNGFSSQFKTSSISIAYEKNLKSRRNLLEIYAKHLINFKRSILLNRRRWRQRMQRRQTLLRSFFVQQVIQLETTFLELVSVPKLIACGKSGKITELCPVPERCLSLYISTRRFFEEEMGLINEEHWLRCFHMKKASFEWICDQLKPNLQQGSGFRGFLSHEKQIALGLYAFSNGIEYVKLVRLFEIQLRSTIYEIIKDIADVILRKWANKLLAMPITTDEFDEIGSSFSMASNMPELVIGVLGICELTTKSAKLSTSIESQSPKIIMQMLIDDKLLFRKVKFDSNQPTLFLEDSNDITSIPPKIIDGHPVPRFVITSDTSYPLKKWLMHKYIYPVEPHEFDFNEAIDNVLVFKNRALIRFFSRWRILNYIGDIDVPTMEKIVLACCILHNLLEVNEEKFDENWSKNLDLENIEFSLGPNLKPFSNKKAYSCSDKDAAELREFLGRTISSTEM
uniref:DDE Tnp4 domain-containing protein n=3 Tax=Ceratitis capitata TaxID=7213 RepID=W8BUL8_CERCA